MLVSKFKKKESGFFKDTMRSHETIPSRSNVGPVYILERLICQQHRLQVRGIVKMRRDHSNSSEKQRIMEDF